MNFIFSIKHNYKKKILKNNVGRVENENCCYVGRGGLKNLQAKVNPHQPALHRPIVIPTPKR